jgi:hypothetical protein
MSQLDNVSSRVTKKKTKVKTRRTFRCMTLLYSFQVKLPWKQVKYHVPHCLSRWCLGRSSKLSLTLCYGSKVSARHPGVFFLRQVFFPRQDISKGVDEPASDIVCSAEDHSINSGRQRQDGFDGRSSNDGEVPSGSQVQDIDPLS